tara:strand:- start:490 stop:663 length:174 start_codon:yes stop_codon:yes gene_type:complete
MADKDPYEPRERVVDLSDNNIENLVAFCSWSLENLGLPNDENLAVKKLKSELLRIGY